jgi:hypothetical protein
MNVSKLEQAYEKERIMRLKKKSTGRILALIPVLLLAAALALTAVSCGDSSDTSQTDSTTKLPPGATGQTLTDTTSDVEATQAQATAEEEEDATADSSTDSSSTSTTDLVKTVYLSGANIAVVSVARDDSNGAALTSSTREVSGDFLLVEMTITNVDDGLVDLSNFSFRLWNPAIDADLYEDFYGSDGTYGSYVSENMISAALLDYETLQSVSYKLRIGETADNLMLFFDLNPQNTARNEGVTMDGTNLVIYDTDTGDSVEVNLSGYAD